MSLRPQRWDVIQADLEAPRKAATTTADRNFYDAVLDELAANRLAPDNMRQAGGFGTPGSLPLIVIAHSGPFQGDDAVLEPTWRAGEQRLAALSTRGKLIVAHKSGHNVELTEPGLIVGAVRDVVAEVRVGK